MVTAPMHVLCRSLLRAFALFAGMAGPVALPPPAGAAAVRDGHVEAGLVSAMAEVAPGDTVTVALRLAMDDGWHTYWRNPGDSGLATTLDWKLPEGFSAGEIQWPAPERHPYDGFVNYGYSGEVLLLVDIATPATARPGDAVTLRARAGWLACEESCVPGGADLALDLRFGAGAVRDARWGPVLDAARARLPENIARIQATAVHSGGNVHIRIPVAPAVAGGREPVFFYMAEEGVLVPSAAPEIRRDGAGWTLVLPVAARSGELPPSLEGVLEWGGPGGVLHTALKAEFVEAAPSAVPLEPRQAGAVPAGVTLWMAMAGAFIGGLILNLMPCVFPVLSIKVLGLVGQAGGDRRAMALHGWIFFAGVMVSFWFLAGLLLVLRAGGTELGWGYQLQSPVFVLALCILLLVFALALMGVYEIGTGAASAAGRLAGGNGPGAGFLGGVLATVLATPCTAPFMGAALAFALTQPAAVSLLVFTLLGAGMALPQLLLSLFPALLRFLPRPGPWMETFKQAMAFPLLATIVWLLWVLSIQVGPNGTAVALGSLVGTGLAMWILGRWAAPVRSPAVRRAAGVVALVVATAAITAGIHAVRCGAPAAPVAEEGAWEAFSPERLEALRASGRPVFVDFTAAWCVTCQANKAVVFSRGDVKEAFARKGVALLRADWTRRDPVIGAALEAHGRNGVPFYVLYAPGVEQPVFASEFVTPWGLIKALGTLGPR